MTVSSFRALLDARKAKQTINRLVRTQVASGLAPLFLERSRPYEADAYLSSLIDEGLLERASFIQKPPSVLRFYRRVLRLLEHEPACILEIGVKGGGSAALWRALYPAAVVVAMDVKLKRWMHAPDDGVIYVQGDQSDKARLDAIAAEHGPFDIVIDDGSHIVAHQASTLRRLLPSVRAGGLYVIEDIHTGHKGPSGHKHDYGDDLWRDFTVAALDHLRRNHEDAPPIPSGGARLAQKLARRIDDLIIGRRMLAIRVVDGRDASKPEKSKS